MYIIGQSRVSRHVSPVRDEKGKILIGLFRNNKLWWVGNVTP